MGRKIPGAKHRGTKDPFAQNARRNAALAKKVNAPPADPDQQDVPRSLERLMRLMQAVKDGAFEGRRRRRRGAVAPAQRPLLPGMMRPEKPTPVFRRRPGESEAGFVRRMEAECQEVVAEAKLEKDYDVSVQRSAATGQVTGVTRRQRIQLDRMLERYDAPASDNKDKNKEEGQPGRKERWKLRKKEKLFKKKQRREEGDEFARFRDHVGFGEVVHAPPVLKAPRRAAVVGPGAETVPRPGKKALLLTAVLEPASGVAGSSSARARSTPTAC
ncbi:coiled-coil domain-containing protein 137 [Bacillus rossius redtenbacheri]|uniref:coiled-coil domain-containing protein 137 n=1 Tax=Bacillus rossius redtenbacheri TaxID=93214 RepID=UPI002FDEBBEF